MQLRRVWLQDFRSHESLEIELDLGLTAVLGDNGVGKTNLLEAIALLSTLRSFRGAPTESLIRRGASEAIIRAEGVRDERDVLIEVALSRQGRTRVQVNRQRVQRTQDLLGALRVMVFAPDDLAMVKDGPAERRRYLDELMVVLDPRSASLQSDLDRVLKQRNALLKQCKGRLDEAAAITLDVWDDKLAGLASELTEERERLVAILGPRLQQSYAVLAGEVVPLEARYERSWSARSLGEALVDGRDDDVRRGVSLIGPHRDELDLRLDGLASRTEASQGEQRTLALAMRLAAHQLATDRLGEAPLLLLDDVLSELDPDRAAALLAHLPPGQSVITSASGLPEPTRPDAVVRVERDGTVALAPATIDGRVDDAPTGELGLSDRETTS